ncbi:LysR family transcriptional regulator [Ideonella azotifigens]|nr:LysR family transcriptional regulator [Ideonella azotifigens]MCD2344592.1 LysR family transcriptional regulator [Ideonella azotifigens]
MDLHQAMQVFTAVVDAGSLTAAGQRLEMSTTMVGNHLRALEQRLGALLLHRTTRRQRLTEFGALYHARCTDILGQIEAAGRLAEDALATPGGTLRVTAPPTFGAECLMPLLPEYLARHPAVKVDVVLTDRVVDLVDEGFDAAFRLGTLESPRLVARPLRDHRLLLCAAPAYVARRGRPVRPQELSGHECLAFTYPAGTEWRWTERQWRFAAAQGGGEIVVAVDGPVAVNQAQALRRAALAGLGIAMLPEVMVAADLAEGRLLQLLTGHALPSRPMHLLYAPERQRSPKLKGFIEFALQAFGDEGALSPTAGTA